MNRKFGILLAALVIMDIMDSDFASLSILDAIKAILYILCFALLIWDSGKGRKA